MQTIIDELILTVVIPGAIAFVTYVIKKVADTIEVKAGIETDMLLSAAMHGAIERYVGAAFKKLGFDPQTGALDPATSADIVDGAKAYVEKMNPDAIVKFGVERVTEAIKAKVGQV